MKKIINAPENYVDEMLEGIYAAHPDKVKCAADDLRCYCTARKKDGKVAIITGGGTGHLPLFLGYVGDGLIDGCGVGGVFQSPSAEQIYNIAKEVEAGAGVLFLYGNYTGDIMNFDMAAEMLEMDDIEAKSIVGADVVLSNVRTVGFALTPCVVPEVGHANFELGDNEMAFGMGIHGEPGVWNGPIKTADELAAESVDEILKDMPVAASEEVALLINGLGATSVEELYILNNSVRKQLDERGIKVYRSWTGEYATSMEMMGASISICKVDDELKGYFDYPIDTPFLCQK